MAVAARMHDGVRSGSLVLMGDERLARLAAAGHERAFTVVYQRYHQPLYRYCRSILRDDSDAQDALQSTFAAAFMALSRGRRDAPIRPWLFRIAHNESVSALRRRRPTADLSTASDACTTSTEDCVAERAELRMLLNDLHELTERQRSALVMRELSGLSHEEIAIALGTSVGTAKQTIYEARRSMFEFAEGREMPCDEIRRTISDADGRALRGRRVRAHLRECSACAGFAAAIAARREDLRVLAPALPASAAVGMFEHLVAASSHGAGGGVAGLATAAAGKTAGAALTANALAGVAVVASATVGVTLGVGSLIQSAGDRAHPSRPVAPAVTPASSGGLITAPAATRTAAGGPARHARGTARSSTSVTVPRAHPFTGGDPTPSRAAAPDRRSAPTKARGLRRHAGAGPGAAGTTTRGNSANAPGHSAAGPGSSATAPGRNKSAATSAAPARGNSANAPGHNKSRAASTATGHGNSASASGHNLPVPAAPPATRVPAAAAPPATPATTPVTPNPTTGSADLAPSRHSK